MWDRPISPYAKMIFLLEMVCFGVFRAVSWQNQGISLGSRTPNSGDESPCPALIYANGYSAHGVTLFDNRFQWLVGYMSFWLKYKSKGLMCDFHDNWHGMKLILKRLASTKGQLYGNLQMLIVSAVKIYKQWTWATSLKFGRQCLAKTFL